LTRKSITTEATLAGTIITPRGVAAFGILVAIRIIFTLINIWYQYEQRGEEIVHMYQSLHFSLDNSW
jgi:hypothetical protein